MKSLDLAYKLVDLKIKSKARDQIYFMSQIFQEHSHCYDKRKKYENENYENLFIFAATPSLSGQGGCCNPPPHPHPHLPTFFTAKIFQNYFHRYMGIWIKGG